MEPESLNVAAVALGTVAAFVFGMILYHPKVLGRTWAEGSGVNLDKGGFPAAAMILQLGALIALALVIGLTATLNLLGTALLAILAVALFVVANGAFGRRSTGAVVTDGIYAIGSGALMIVAQGLL
ncbi:MAG: DUF1761 domain-containing protein [Silicimonas sp.]|nr:DUF1761 domain-containing protein [Silicimonas sp.]